MGNVRNMFFGNTAGGYFITMRVNPFGGQQFMLGLLGN